MQYEDETRQYNFLSGLMLGTLLGIGAALLARPVRGRLLPRRGRRSWIRRRRSRSWLGGLNDGLFEPLADTLSAGRKRLKL